MDSNPPTAADYAWHAARDAAQENQKLTARLFLVEARLNDLMARITEIESKLSTTGKEKNDE